MRNIIEIKYIHNTTKSPWNMDSWITTTNVTKLYMYAYALKHKEYFLHYMFAGGFMILSHESVVDRSYRWKGG